MSFMRTTLTIEEDVAAKLQKKLKKSIGKTFKDVVNETLRLGLLAEIELKETEKFQVRSRALGVNKGLNYDNIGELIEQIEGVNK
ncbi:MAG: hypothetical protein H0U50_10465 [Pyrinomonadaceae bacterium]|nr:hypothetical protein [Pyrinomonadaceae bacterium]